MPTLSETLPHLVHVGAILYLICFLFRDQILLRSFAIASDLVYVAYYFTIADQPLWGAILWNIPAVGINLAMIALILRDRGTASFSENELKFYGRLPSIEPGEFRKLLRAGKWVTARLGHCPDARGREAGSCLLCARWRGGCGQRRPQNSSEDGNIRRGTGVFKRTPGNGDGDDWAKVSLLFLAERSAANGAGQ